MTPEARRVAWGRSTTHFLATVLLALCSWSEADAQDSATVGRGDEATVPGRQDSLIWNDRENDSRGVLVSISIPAATDSAVIHLRQRDSLPEDDRSNLTILGVRVNSVPVAMPPVPRRIMIRPWDRGALNVTILVKLRRCSPLDFAVLRYPDGRERTELPQGDDDLPPCCT